MPRRSSGSRRCAAAAIRHSDTDGVRPSAVAAVGDRRHARRAGRARSARRDAHRRRMRSRCSSARSTICSHAGSPRGWHRAAHALVALATAAPERGTAALAQFTGVADLAAPHVRGARRGDARRIATTLERWPATTTTTCGRRRSRGCASVAGHDADAIYVAALDAAGQSGAARRRRSRWRARRSADAAVPALKAALAAARRARDSDNSHDARDAIAKTLASLGADRREARQTRVDVPTRPARARSERRRPAAARVAARADHDPRRRHVRAGAVHRRRRRRRSSASRASRSPATTTASRSTASRRTS